jgi:hypothetical protein
VTLSLPLSCACLSRCRMTLAQASHTHCVAPAIGINVRARSPTLGWAGVTVKDHATFHALEVSTKALGTSSFAARSPRRLMARSDPHDLPITFVI